MNTVSNPRLTEPGVKFFLNQTLKNCHQTKKNYHNMYGKNVLVSERKEMKMRCLSTKSQPSTHFLLSLLLIS